MAWYIHQTKLNQTKRSQYELSSREINSARAGASASQQEQLKIELITSGYEIVRPFEMVLKLWVLMSFVFKTTDR